MVSAVGEAEALHAQARAALETWLDALRQSRCDAVLAGLARSSPIWERRAPLEQACRTDDEALASWRGRQVGEVVWAERNRVTFRLTGGETPTYAVMVREDDQWRYAGDVFTSWTPRPGECASAALLAR